MFSVIKTQRIWFSLSALMFALSIGAIAIWGFKLGIDFTGGSLLEVHVSGTPIESQAIGVAVEAALHETAHVQSIGDDGYIIRTKVINEMEHAEILTALQKIETLGTIHEERFETVGPTVSAELQRRAMWAIVAVMVAIIVYIAWAFRQVSHPISSWKYGVVAIVALLHDVLIPSGIFAALGHFYGYEIDVLFVTALLTILGFSVHDTIVTFDRVREHLRATPKADFSELVDKSVRETIRRSINTSMTVLLVLLSVYFFGGESVKQFNLVLILGVVFGTYSSIFIACPLLVVWTKLAQKGE